MKNKKQNPNYKAQQSFSVGKVFIGSKSPINKDSGKDTIRNEGRAADPERRKKYAALK